MARYHKGVMGDFKGTVGTVVGANWKGISYMRSKTRKIVMTPSARQLKHRARFFAMCFAILLFGYSLYLGRIGI